MLSRLVGAPISRGRLLAALAAGGAAAGALTGEAAADALPDADAAYVRLLIAAELLAVDFYAQASASRLFRRPVAAHLRQALADERLHYGSLSQVLAAAGGSPLAAADVDFSYPAGSFASSASIARLGVEVERVVLGCYLGAIAGLATAAVRLPVGQIAANE